MWTTPYISRHILNCGLAPFDFIYASDHRGLYMDLDLKHVLDANNIQIQPMPYRRLTSTIPKRTELYRKEVNLKWENHRIRDKINDLITLKQ